MASMSFTQPAALRRIETIKRLLEQEDQTVASVSGQVFISRRWAREYLDHLRSIGLAHICGYKRELEGERSYPRAIFRIGSGVDAKKPKALTNKQRTARRRQRRKDDPEFYLRERSLNRLRKMRPKPDAAAAWLLS